MSATSSHLVSNSDILVKPLLFYFSVCLEPQEQKNASGSLIPGEYMCRRGNPLRSLGWGWGVTHRLWGCGRVLTQRISPGSYQDRWVFALVQNCCDTLTLADDRGFVHG